MLLPSAFCDQSQATGTKVSRPLLERFITYTGSSSGSDYPTISRLRRNQVAFPALDTAITCLSPNPSMSTGIQSTCRALQAFLGVTPSSTISTTMKSNKIPLPPTVRSSAMGTFPIKNNRISKKRTSPTRPSGPSRGNNKRTRDDYELSELKKTMEQYSQASYNHEYSYDSGYPSSNSSDADAETASLESETKGFSTPKRRRRLPGPIHLPFGLDRSDFADLRDSEAISSTAQPFLQTSSSQTILSESIPHTPEPLSLSSSFAEGEATEEEWWTPLDDAQLVTLVLEKMRLSRRDWEECAKVLGAEGEGVTLGKRWQWLMEEGKIGLNMGIKGRGRFEGRRTSKRQGRGDVRLVF